MKKITLLLLSLIFSAASIQAEEFINEPFDTWPPEGWEIIEGPGTAYYSHWWHRESQFACVFVTADNQDEWLITPEVTLPEVGDLRLSCDFMGAPYRMITLDGGDFHIYVSTDNGTSWDTLWKEDDQQMVEESGVVFPWGHNEWFYPSISLDYYAGQTIKIAFRYLSPDYEADWWNIDNVVVKRLVENEVVLEEFPFPDYGMPGDELTFEGTFKNLGSNNVTSYEVIYSVNGIDSDPLVVEDVDIAHNTTESFTHHIPFTFSSPEIYDVSLRIDKVNGVDDAIPENNILLEDITIASETVDRKPLFELFTSSTCAPCLSGNEAIDAVLNENEGLYSLVKYQVYWPGNGDPYTIIEDSLRAEYYDVGGVPRLITNGLSLGGPSGFSQTTFNTATNEPGYANMSLTYSFDGLHINAEVTVDPTINISDASIHIAVVEKTTYGNVGTNGETEFHNVLMSMLPDAYGNNVSLEIGTPVSILESKNLITSFIEEFEDLQVVAWVQDNETRYVLQSECSDLMVGLNESAYPEFVIYPNPAKDYIYIKSTENTEIQITDISGKVVYKGNSVSINTKIDISHLNKGFYFVELFREGYNHFTTKLVKQ